MDLLVNLPNVNTETGFCDRVHNKKLAFHILGGMIVDHHLLSGGFRSRGDLPDGTGGGEYNSNHSNGEGNVNDEGECEINEEREPETPPEPASIRIRRSELEVAISSYELQLALAEKELPWPRSSPAVISLFPIAYLSMSIAVSVEDIIILTGKEGEEVARRMRGQMRKWTETRASRKAIWYAGQVLWCFQLLKKVTSLQVVLAYHAGLVLYAFATLLNRPDGKQTVRWASRPSVKGPGSGVLHLYLNGTCSSPTSSQDVQTFIGEGTLEPLLQGVSDKSAPVSFQDAGEVLRVVCEIIVDRTCTCEGLSWRPVQGLMGLLKGLRGPGHMPQSV